MTFWEKLKHLSPKTRRVRERDMQEELESLREMAEPNELGNITGVAEDIRQVWTWTWVEHLAQDIRYAVRSMIHNKAFAVLAITLLALGIGANAAIYSFMESVFFRSLPVEDPDSLVVMKWRTADRFPASASSGFSLSTEGSHSDAHGFVGTQFPYPALKLFQDGDDVVSAAFCYFSDQFSVSLNDQTDVMKGQYVSGNYFQGMGVRPVSGRFFVDEDDVAGAAPVAVVSYRLSRGRLGSATAAVGQTIRINNQAFSVIGVVPSEFFGAEPGEVPDVYLPMRAELLFQSGPVAGFAGGSKYADAGFYWIEIMGRLKPDVSLSQAQAALEPRFRRFVEEAASTEAARAEIPTLMIESGSSGLDSMRRLFAKPLYVLMTMSGLILLIACANIASLLLARAVARRREIAVRLSIGAGRWRIIRQLLTESVLLSCLGGAIGVVFAWWGVSALTLVFGNGRENFTLHAGINLRVVAVSAALSILTGVLFGLLPAIQATRADVTGALKEMRPGVSIGKARRLKLSHVLIVGQIALSLCLLVGAALFVRTLSNLHAIPLGFGRDGVLLFRINPTQSGYEPTAFNRLYEDVRTRLSQMPGVRSVSYSTAPFPSGGGTMSPVLISGVEAPAVAAGGQRPNQAVIFFVGPSFFEGMQMPRVAGRDFTDRDVSGAPRVVVINERLARVFGLENPVGRTLTRGKDSYQIVGVVHDAVSFTLKGEYRPVAYFHILQGARAPGAVTYEVRSTDNPLHHAATVRQIVRQIDSRIAVSNIKTQAAHVDEGISSEIALARLCSMFAGLALIIACVGLYGTVAFHVARRTHEMGIRIAIGAQRSHLLWMILRQVFALSIGGLLIGMPLALVGTRFIKSFLFGIEPNDPIALTTAATLLLVAALLAGYLPARRALKIDPGVALRHD